MTSLPTALKKPKHSPPLPQEPPPAASSLSLRVSRTFWAARQTLSQSCAQRPQHSANPARVGGGTGFLIGAFRPLLFHASQPLPSPSARGLWQQGGFPPSQQRPLPLPLAREGRGSGERCQMNAPQLLPLCSSTSPKVRQRKGGRQEEAVGIFGGMEERKPPWQCRSAGKARYGERTAFVTQPFSFRVSLSSCYAGTQC